MTPFFEISDEVEAFQKLKAQKISEGKELWVGIFFCMFLPFHIDCLLLRIMCLAEALMKLSGLEYL